MSMFNDPARYEALRRSSAEHVRRYRESSGADGHISASGTRNLLLTTSGRRSGEPRTTPLIYGRDGDRYIIVGSLGGAERHPKWYLNLLEHPEVEVQVGEERFSAVARSAGAEEKPRLWKLMTEVFPSYHEYQARTERDIPVIVLEREDSRKSRGQV